MTTYWNTSTTMPFYYYQNKYVYTLQYKSESIYFYVFIYLLNITK